MQKRKYVQTKGELKRKTTFNSNTIIIAKISDIYNRRYLYSILANSISCEDGERPLPDKFAALTEWLMKSESECLTMYKNDNVPACVLG